MQRVAEWLEKLGMSEYAQRFAENRIDFSVLPDLTDHDLEKLGVVLGDRRKMLRAIANLEAHKITVAAAAPAAQPRDTAERRQVTVMFSDLVGSTALSTRMDPEDLREVISAYQNFVAATVGRFGGFVARYIGDGVLIYFGYPHAHEHDAERAVRAGLRWSRRCPSSRPQPAFPCRRASGSPPGLSWSATSSAVDLSTSMKWWARRRTWLPGYKRWLNPARC